MTFKEVCENRFSVRKFLDKAVEEEKIQELLNLARLSPTAVNNQPYFIYVVKSPEKLKELRGVARCAFDAPVVFAVCAEENKGWSNPFSGEPSVLQDTAIVTTTLMYGATALGLGSVYVCYYDPKVVEDVLEIPKNLSLKALLPVGYYASDLEPSFRHFEKRDLKDIYKEI